MAIFVIRKDPFNQMQLPPISSDINGCLEVLHSLNRGCAGTARHTLKQVCGMTLLAAAALVFDKVSAVCSSAESRHAPPYPVNCMENSLVGIQYLLTGSLCRFY